MSLQLRLNIPVNAANKEKIKDCISFLQDSYELGTYKLFWECPISLKFVGIDFERRERPSGEYYREPYPMTLQIISPETAGFPQIVFPLTDMWKQELLSFLQLELKK